ncbi:2-C-methyl-D-erythritol 2,4-cyclodiphosphate synthase [Mycoplasmatota bacterium WC44]
MRIGHSIDVHKFDSSKKLILGGIEIDYKGLLGHSDADVLLHVVAESMLGALALGDLGKLFPDNDLKYKNIESKYFVLEAMRLITEKGYKVANIDCMVLAEKPKLSPYVLNMRENIAQLLNVQIDRVSIKATTTEKLGFIGKEEGIMSSATILLEEIK